MSILAQIGGPLRDPLDAILDGADGAVLAVICGVEGPSYRPLGAMMAILPDGSIAGTLSSGCIEADIALHAARTRMAGRPARVRYGAGSPFVDIRLPCGGGLEILLLPRPERRDIAAAVAARQARRPVTLSFDTRDGRVGTGGAEATGWTGDVFHVRIDPAIRFAVFGKGPEAATFAALVQAAGYPNALWSPDAETRHAVDLAGIPTAALPRPAWPADAAVDAWTAIVLFFHDHEWEPPILAGALGTEAVYIGAQGSRRARAARDLELEALGVDAAARARLRGPIGLIPSARDAGTLAVSVLAEILAVAQSRTAAETAGGPRPKGPA